MKQFITLVLSCILFIQCKTEDGFTINGHITGLEDGTTVAVISNDAAKAIGDTEIEDGKFVLKAHYTDDPQNYILQFKSGDELLHAFVFIGGHDNITITGDKKDIPYDLKVTGSKYQDAASVLNIQTAKLEKQRRQVENEFFAYSEKEQESETINDLFWGENGKGTKIDNELKDLTVAYIKQNPNSQFAMQQLIYQLDNFSKEEVSNILSKTSPEVQQSIQAKAIKSYLEAETIEKGKKVPAFSATDEDDKDHDIYTLFKKKKYTLLDFSTPHCGYCTLSKPVLKKLAEKNKANLQVVSVCIDKNMDTWKAENEKEGVSWLALIAKDGRYSKANMQYKINGTPAFFLVDSQGRLVHTQTGFSKDLDKDIAPYIK